MSRAGFADRVASFEQACDGISATKLRGRVAGVTGLAADIAGLSRLLVIGDRVSMWPARGASIAGDVVAFRGQRTQAVVQGRLEGLGPGSLVELDPARRTAVLPVDMGWLGRVIDPLGQPLDGRGPLPEGRPLPLRAGPPPAAARARLGARLDLGVRVLDAFTPCLRGQRIGLFAGSGVGKSTLLGMLARNVDCDVVVIALVGERGREVKEFLEDELGADGARKAVTVVATSDAAPLLRREAAYAALTVAEYFRDLGQSVLLLMDSVTRLCTATREIALACGEPAAARGWPPSVFADLPNLLERAGPGLDGSGSITAIFTVLVDGDDHNEPVADAVRGMLDGHVVLDRSIAERGRYPAVDIARSLSRTTGQCLSPAEGQVVRRARAIQQRSAELADMVRLGAYKAGTDAEADEALALQPRLERWLNQDRAERSPSATTMSELALIMNPL